MRLTFGIVLILWGLVVATSAVLKPWPKDLTDAGWLGEMTCPLTLIVGGGVLLWTSRKPSVVPKDDSSGRDRPPGPREVPPSTETAGGGTELGDPGDRGRKAGPGAASEPPRPGQ